MHRLLHFGRFKKKKKTKEPILVFTIFLKIYQPQLVSALCGSNEGLQKKHKISSLENPKEKQNLAVDGRDYV